MAEKVYKKHRLAQQRPRRSSALYDWPTPHSVTLRIVHARASLSPHTAASAATTTTTIKGGVRRTCVIAYLIDVLLTMSQALTTDTHLQVCTAGKGGAHWAGVSIFTCAACVRVRDMLEQR
jgi:hypothetical protein